MLLLQIWQVLFFIHCIANLLFEYFFYTLNITLAGWLKRIRDVLKHLIAVRHRHAPTEIQDITSGAKKQPKVWSKRCRHSQTTLSFVQWTRWFITQLECRCGCAQKHVKTCSNREILQILVILELEDYSLIAFWLVHKLKRTELWCKFINEQKREISHETWKKCFHSDSRCILILSIILSEHRLKSEYLLNLDHEHERQSIDCSKWALILEQNSHWNRKHRKTHLLNVRECTCCEPVMDYSR